METAEQTVEAMEFIAPILEAQMRFDQAVTNQLMESAWADAAKWASRFLRLITELEKANDSIRVARILDAHWQPDTKRQIEHYRSMAAKMAEAT